MQVVSTIGLITINETVVIELISFLIFLFLINRIMFRPLRDVINERQTHIEDISSGIEKSKTQLTEMNEQVRAQELTAIKEANQHKKNLEEDGVIQANTLLDESRKEIQAIKLESQQFINSQITKARAEIKNESQKLAVLIMEKVLDRRLAQ
jgi:F-type H+-transporting ATPase subunit b